MNLTRVRVALCIILVFSASAVSLTQAVADPASSVHDHQFGAVHFPVSCSPAAQAQFDTAASMLHSFYYPETIKAFTKVTEIDPTCAMAYWGIALSQRPNPLVGPFAPEALQRGFEAIQKGKSLNPKTQRERDWLDAAEPFFKDAAKLDQKTRTKAYEKAMEHLYVRYPDDSEAAVFYALALNESADLADKSRANQLKAAAILEKVKVQQPNHPGVAHYLIHSYDYAGIADRGISAADQYAAIAPSAPHALHMPSHTYTILGMWEKSIESNKAALAAAKEYAAQHYPPGTADPSEPHFLDFMQYDYLQLGQDKQAKAVVEQAASLNKFPVMRPTVAFGLAAVPARYTLERSAWVEAAQLQPRESQYAYTQAITYFARAMGAAKTGNTKQAREDIEKLHAAHEADLARPEQAYWAGQSNVLLQAASAWLAHAEGNNAEAVKLLRSGADLEDSTDKNVAMENRLFPIREQLGYMLLELDQPKQAITEFDLSLKATPNRLRGLYGAAKAAQLAGDAATARARYRELLELTKNADSERPEITEAKRFIAARQ
jgi:tetratricopeptide (TPR) repeat protein